MLQFPSFIKRDSFAKGRVELVEIKIREGSPLAGKQLLDLYKTKNITRVAHLHYLSQPAMTKRIRRIEEELGSELILRSQKGITFTPAGELAMPEKRMLKICCEDESVVLSLTTPMSTSAIRFAASAKEGEINAVTSSGTTAIGTKYGFSFEEK